MHSKEDEVENYLKIFRTTTKKDQKSMESDKKEVKQELRITEAGVVLSINGCPIPITKLDINTEANHNQEDLVVVDVTGKLPVGETSFGDWLHEQADKQRDILDSYVKKGHLPGGVYGVLNKDSGIFTQKKPFGNLIFYVIIGILIGVLYSPFVPIIKNQILQFIQ